MRFVEKESKPLKVLIRDALLVYFSVVFGIFVMEQLKPMSGEGPVSQQVFTDNPEF